MRWLFRDPWSLIPSRCRARSRINLTRNVSEAQRQGLNPFLLTATPRHHLFLHSYATKLSRGGVEEHDVKYEWIDGVEDLSEYQNGGYHPVLLGYVIHRRYLIVDKLGHGGHSTVWLARDEKMQRLVALKVGISHGSSTRHETAIMQALSGPSTSSSTGLRALPSGKALIPVVLDEFEIEGPNGAHPCYTTEPAQGDLRKASENRLFPLEVARALSAALATAVSYVHSKHFVHADIRLRNVLVKLPSHFPELTEEQLQEQYGKPETHNIRRIDGKKLSPHIMSQAVTPIHLGKRADHFTLNDAGGLLLNDFGTAFAPASEPRLAQDTQTPIALRAPEILFDPRSRLSYPADIWGLALSIFEIVGMRSLFGEHEEEFEVAAQQIDALGREEFPTEWWASWENRGEYFSEQHRDRKHPAIDEREATPPLAEAFEKYVQRWRKLDKMGEFSYGEKKALLDMMQGMLKFRPEQRWTAEQVLHCEWMIKWALPEFEKSKQ